MPRGNSSSYSNEMARVLPFLLLFSLALAQSTLGNPTPTMPETPAWLIFFGIGLAVAVGVGAMIWIKRPVQQVNRRRREELD